MARLFLLLAACISILAGPPYTPERMPPITTNRVFSATVSSNWVIVTVLEPPLNPHHFNESVLFARRLSSPDSTYQRLTVDSVNGYFGMTAAIHNGTLIAKDGVDTYFFREEGDRWVPDGKINGEGRYMTASGIIAADDNHLILGSELYEWPSRRYVQTFDPILWNATFLGSRLAITYPIDQYPGVWLLEKVGGLWRNPQRLPEPPRAEGSRFGLSLANARQGEILLVAAPEDDVPALDSGAVHVYLRTADGQNFNYHQKLKPPMAMQGDAFGSAIAVEGGRIYISAPNRNEERQRSGAIYVFEARGAGTNLYVVETAKITWKDTFDFAALGLRMAVANGVVYGLVGQQFARDTGLIAFHPPTALTPSRVNGAFDVTASNFFGDGTLESTADLNAPWQAHAADHLGSIFRTGADEGARFFRLRKKSAF